jgi:hypothetical protein
VVNDLDGMAVKKEEFSVVGALRQEMAKAGDAAAHRLKQARVTRERAGVEMERAQMEYNAIQRARNALDGNEETQAETVEADRW